MTTAVQVQYRRGSSAQVASFTGAQGEMVVDTTNNRIVVQDGSTAGGWPAAKLAEVQTNTRTQVSDGNYTAQTTDRLVAYITITAARTVSLPAASAFPGGSRLLVVDESGGCSATNTITLAANGSDLVDGAASALIQSAYGYIALESNTFNKWTIVDATNGVTLTSPSISGGSINSTVIGGTTPASVSATTLSLARHAVSDANYTVAFGVSTVAYTAITAARTVSLPASSTFNAGQQLLVVDESGSCSATKTITLSVNGSDKIDGASSAVINAPYGYIGLASNASGNWTVIDQGPQVLALNGLVGGVTLAASDGSSISASGSTVTIGSPGGMVNKFRNATMDVWQRGTTGTVTTSGGYTADGWIVLPTGASATWAQAGGRLSTKSSLQVTGASSITDLIIKQRIESLIAAAYCSQTVTVQAQVYNNTGGSITPKLTVNRPSAQDNYGTVTADVNAVSLQSCGNGAWTQIAYTFSANAASYNGLEIVFDFGNNFSSSSKDIQITECDIRVTPGASTGLNSNPPPPELRPVGMELAFCQRYFSSSFFNGTTPANDSSAYIEVAGFYYGTNVWATQNISLPAQMRATPAITFYSSNQGSSPTSGQWQTYNAGWGNTTSTQAIAVTPTSFMIDGDATGTTGAGAFFAGGWAASAEL